MTKKIIILIATVAVFLSACSVFIPQSKKSTPGPPSIDEQFYLMRINDESKVRVAFCVVPTEKYCIKNSYVTQSDILYTTVEWYSGYSRVEGSWGVENNDFFVISGDTGIYCFKYEDSTWNCYHLLTERDENGKRLLPLSFEIKKKGSDDSREPYDSNNIPENVISYCERF